MKKALVTGGAGFIGSHIVDALLEQGWSVRILDDFSTGSMGNLPLRGSYHVLQGSIVDPDLCRRACDSVDCVFHLAGIASVNASITEAKHSHEVNLTGTLNLLEAARACRVHRIVFSSSASVYGDAEGHALSEEQPVSPQSPYAAQKAAGEFYCRQYWKLHGLETVSLRYFNVFGPRQSAASGYAAAIPLFIRAAIENTTATVYGDGLQSRDFVYVRNVADANIAAALTPDIAGHTFNVASGRAITILDLLLTIEAIAGRTLSRQFAPPRAGEVRHSCGDIDKARRMLAYVPAISLRDGLTATLEEFANFRLAAQSDSLDDASISTETEDELQVA